MDAITHGTFVAPTEDELLIEQPELFYSADNLTTELEDSVIVLNIICHDA
ncbi:hypothetical protein [Photobacterium sanguinicancri]|uniref:Uncharacterized protein n=1 Tax=Photobacterium sanguinicancri TaxID=875932 RepID=A0AAW7Y0B2_9GAMM|nr:hypothetical protein [Photobacterium sanguinicancri]MDO6541831.1 hypothetical protein [Photobacterium sanguinicancri]